MILKPRDEDFIFPTIYTPSDIFKYIAEFNEFQYYETDLTGVTVNEIKPQLFFINRIDLVTPNKQQDEQRFDGYLFVGVPSDISQDVNSSDFNDGQFVNIIEELIKKEFTDSLTNLVSCDYRILINNVRPIYNTVKYTKATNCTGVEIFYSIWI